MQAGAWMVAVDDCDAVVNLVGEGIFNRRWRAAFKQLLYDSRIKSTENVFLDFCGTTSTSGSGGSLASGGT